MTYSRVTLGPVAAVLAVVCVLGPAPPAPASAGPAGGERGGFSGLLLDRGRCCGTDGPQADIAMGHLGVDGLAAGGGAGGQARPRLAQTEPAGEAPETPREPDPEPDTDPATESPDPGAIKDPETIPLTVPELGGDSFKGSVKPAGPDLTPAEERELITGGWD